LRNGNARYKAELSGQTNARDTRSLKEHETSKIMKNQRSRVQRLGQIYRFSIDGLDYAAFIWQFGVRFRGRVEGNPQVPECTGRTALAVRDALQLSLTTQAAA
jgi:hypothetical protein